MLIEAHTTAGYINSNILKDILSTSKDATAKLLVQTILKDELGSNHPKAKRKDKRMATSTNAFEKAKLQIGFQNNIFEFGKIVNLDQKTVEALERNFFSVMKEVKTELTDLLQLANDETHCLNSPIIIAATRAVSTIEKFAKVLSSNSNFAVLKRSMASYAAPQETKFPATYTKRVASKQLSLDGINGYTAVSTSSSIDGLLNELKKSSSTVEKYERLVDRNITWVQANCNFHDLVRSLPVRAKKKCKLLAISKLFEFLNSWIKKIMKWSLRQWKSSCFQMQLESEAIRYCKIKCIQKLEVLYYATRLKYLKANLNIWKCRIVKERFIEINGAACQIQRFVRGILCRFSFRMKRNSKFVVRIQSFIRKYQAKILVHRLKTDHAETMSMQKLKIFLKAIILMRRAKFELKKLRDEKAATQIQKVFRGKMMRNEVAATENVSFDLEKLAAISSNNSSRLDGIDESWVAAVSNDTVQHPIRRPLIAKEARTKTVRSKSVTNPTVNKTIRKQFQETQQPSISIKVRKNKPNTSSDKSSKKKSLLISNKVAEMEAAPTISELFVGKDISTERKPTVDDVSSTDICQPLAVNFKADYLPFSTLESDPNLLTEESTRKLSPREPSSTTSKIDLQFSFEKPPIITDKGSLTPNACVFSDSPEQIVKEKEGAINSSPLSNQHSEISTYDSSSFFEYAQIPVGQAEETIEVSVPNRDILKLDIENIENLKPSGIFDGITENNKLSNMKQETRLSVEQTLNASKIVVPIQSASKFKEESRELIEKNASTCTKVNNLSQVITDNKIPTDRTKQPEVDFVAATTESNIQSTSLEPTLSCQISMESAPTQITETNMNTFVVSKPLIPKSVDSVSPSISNNEFISATSNPNKNSDLHLTKIPTQFDVLQEKIDLKHEKMVISVTKIQNVCKLFVSRRKIFHQKIYIQKIQREAAETVNWSVISIQKLFRVHIAKLTVKYLRNQISEKQNANATKIQSRLRGIRGRRKFQFLLKKREEDQKQIEIIKSYQRRDSTTNPKVSDLQSDPVQQNSRQAAEIIVVQDAATIENENKLKQIDEKLLALSDLERRLKESEEKVRLEMKLAEEKVQTQLKKLEEKTLQVEAEAKAREALMQLAVGPLSHRSPYATLGENNNISSARSTSRSITPSSKTVVVVNQLEWVRIWDNAQAVFYWWCESKQLAQWDDPRGSTENKGTDSDSIGGLTDYSTDGDEFTIEQPKESSSTPWQEYWDEQAQAKYWYNNETGEASWTLPDGGAVAAKPEQRSNNNGWVSYIDEETGHLYWHNIYTGEVQWDV